MLDYFKSNKDVFSIISGAVSSIAIIITFAFGIFQYRNAQKWKRNEFLAEKVKEFFGDEEAMNMFQMMDYCGKKFRFVDDDGDAELIVMHDMSVKPRISKKTYVENLGYALRFHEDKDELINPAQEYIRTIFDIYCSYLQGLQFLFTMDCSVVKS